MKHILIIDDYFPLLNSLRIALELNEYKVEISQTPSCLLEDNGLLPDILLTDHHLPNLADNNWLETVKNNPRLKHIPIILMSGNMDIEEIAKGLNVDDFILKPINIDNLLTKLNFLTMLR